MVYQQMKYAKNERGYWYYRRAGVRQRIEGDFGSAKWLRNYARIHATFEGVAADPREGLFRDLASKYLDSGEFRKLAPGSQGVYRRFVGMAVKVFGDYRPDDITMPVIVALRDKLADTPAKANQLMKVLRLIFGWGIPRGLVKTNPADFRHTSIKAFEIGEHSPWPEAEIERFVTNCKPELAWVTLGALYLGQRIGDTIEMGWNDIDNGRIAVTQEKTGKALMVPIHPDMARLLDVIPRRSVRIFTTSTGRVWTYENWQRSALRERQKFGLGHLTTHGLRKNAVCRLLYAGCSAAEVGSITGQTQQMVDHYAKQIEQEKLAQVAMTKYAEWSAGR